MESAHLSPNSSNNLDGSDLSFQTNHEDSDCAWIEQSAFDGITEGQILLGLLYERGLITPFINDFQRAKSWYLTASEAGDAHANFHLYRLSLSGAAIGLLCRSRSHDGLVLAANAGHCLAQYEVGQGCGYGTFDERICQDPSYWYGLAANSGLAVAHDALGRWELTQVSEEPRGEKWAANHFMKAACLGHEPAEERVCGFDREVLFDIACWREAVSWFKTMARNDDNPVANWMLSKIYADGLAGNPDAFKATFWLVRAASLGHAVAQCTLGSRYENGIEVPQDLDSAHLWYHQAADQGYLPAQIAEGRLIESGQLRCYHSLDDAVDFYRRASSRSLVAQARYLRFLIHKKSEGRVPLSALPMPTWLQGDDKWIIDDWLE